MAASLTCLGAVVDAAASEVFEIDLVFPRNKTYAPTDSLPVVFAFRNAQFIQGLYPHLSYSISNYSDSFGNGTRDFSYQSLPWEDWSSQEPYFKAAFFKNFTTEGLWRLRWTIAFESCNKDVFVESSGQSGATSMFNQTISVIDFTIKKGGQAVDIVGATEADAEACPEEFGLALNATVLEIDGKQCRALPDSASMSPSPCQVKVDSAVAASLTASWEAVLCRWTVPRPANCPAETKNASQRLAVASVASLVAVMGALGFFLA